MESFDSELAGLIQQHHYRIELGLRQVQFIPFLSALTGQHNAIQCMRRNHSFPQVQP